MPPGRASVCAWRSPAHGSVLTFSIGEEQTPYVNGMFRPIAYRLEWQQIRPVAGHANEKVKSGCAGFCFRAGFFLERQDNIVSCSREFGASTGELDAP